MITSNIKNIYKPNKNKAKFNIRCRYRSSSLKLYANIVKAYKEGKVSFKEITTFNLDEYEGLEGTQCEK